MNIISYVCQFVCFWPQVLQKKPVKLKKPPSRQSTPVLFESPTLYPFTLIWRFLLITCTETVFSLIQVQSVDTFRKEIELNIQKGSKSSQVSFGCRLKTSQFIEGSDWSRSHQVMRLLQLTHIQVIATHMAVLYMVLDNHFKQTLARLSVLLQGKGQRDQSDLWVKQTQSGYNLSIYWRFQLLKARWYKNGANHSVA